jgi:crotonobetainyl-CoA:carnitine CoA-transferase CaiB-like acyl-CoA transferase
LNTGKKSVTLAFRTPAGREILKALLNSTDVLVHSIPPREVPGLGLDGPTLRALDPRLVIAAVSNFGSTGPYRDYEAEEMQFYAMSGGMYATGEARRAPLAAGPAVCQYTAGARAYAAILMALFQRHRSGAGQQVEISIFESSIDQVETGMAGFLQRGKVAKRGAHAFAPWGLYRCEDGYAVVVGAPFRHWTRGATIFEEPRLLQSKFRHVRDRVQHRQEIDALIQPWLDRHTKKEVCRAGLERGMAFGYLAEFAEVFDSPQHRARQFFQAVEHPVAGRHAYCGPPFKLPDAPWTAQRAPLLGEHNTAVYGGLLGYSDAQLESLRAEGVV